MDGSAHGNVCVLGPFRGGSLSQINFAAEYGIIFDGEPKCCDVALYIAPRPKFNTATGDHISLNTSHNQNILRSKVSCNIGTCPHSQAALVQGYRSLNPAIHNQVFAASHFSADNDALSDSRLNVLTCHVHILPRV